MQKSLSIFFKINLAMLLSFFACNLLTAQPELQPWGNLSGIRIDGQLMNFETNISVVKKNWSGIAATGKERQQPKYMHNGNEQVVTTNIDSLYFTETVTDAPKNSAKINVQVNAKADQSIEGI